METLPISVIKQKIAYLSDNPELLQSLVGLMKSELVNVWVDLAIESGHRPTQPTSTASAPTHQRRRSESLNAEMLNDVSDQFAASRVRTMHPIILVTISLGHCL